jgi:tryptophan-rich sensory protein
MFPCVSARPHPQTAAEHRTISWEGVVAIVAVCLAVQAVGGLLTAEPVRSWYASLPKPDWTAPSWVFGPVWTALYLMMAVAGSLVWLSRDRDEVGCPLTAFGVQLAANLGWTLMFFGLHSPLLGLIDIVVLWLAVGLTTIQFFRVCRTAGWLFVPYWAWVSYAMLLNGSIVFRMY